MIKASSRNLGFAVVELLICCGDEQLDERQRLLGPL